MEINSITVAGDKPASDGARTLGEILVEMGKLSPVDVENIQRFAAEKSIRFSEAAVRLGLLMPSEIEMAVSRQPRYPVLSRGNDPEFYEQGVVAAYEPPDHVATQIRALRSALMFQWLDDAQRKVLAITSPGRGEGRSWLAANLAVALAQIGKRTLLIDADMRNPYQHRLFNIENSSGLSSLLSGHGSVFGYIRVHSALQLHVVPAGAVPPNPEELLASPLFGALLDGLASKFDVVMLDTPPALPTTDTQLIAAKAGNALVLARGDHTRRASLKSLMAAFKQAKVNVVGSVVNSHAANDLAAR